jgi:DNA polymerase-3 subunit delta'
MGVDAARWLALPRALVDGRAAAFAGWPIPRVLDAMQKICHDAMVMCAGGAPRYFAPQALPQGAQLGQLAQWARSLARTMRHDEHPWNEALLIEALLCEGRACWQDATKRAAPARQPLATLNR